MPTDPIPEAHVREIDLARRCVRWSAYAFAAAIAYVVLYILADDHISLWPMVVLAAIQSLAALGAVLIGMFSKSGGTMSVSTVLVGILLGAIGVIGILF